MSIEAWIGLVIGFLSIIATVIGAAYWIGGVIESLRSDVRTAMHLIAALTADKNKDRDELWAAIRGLDETQDRHGEQLAELRAWKDRCHLAPG